MLAKFPSVEIQASVALGGWRAGAAAHLVASRLCLRLPVRARATRVAGRAPAA